MDDKETEDPTERRSLTTFLLRNGRQIMWKAIFLAAGISMIIVGVESLVVEKAVFAARGEKKQTAWGTSTQEVPRKEVEPAEWFPWSMMSGGVGVLIYASSFSRIVGSD